MSSHNRRSWILVVSLCVVSGCSSTADRPSSDQGSAQQPVGCAGTARVACAAGEQCFIVESERSKPEAVGTCATATPNGPTCGGIAGLACPVGDECFVAEAERNIPDASGTCRSGTPGGPDAGADDGGTSGNPICGGIANLPCPAGRSCVVADADKNTPDATGTCR